MMTLLIVFWLCLMCPEYTHCVANMRYFETLSDIGVTSRVRRASSGVRELIKQVRFRVFERDFHITLKSGAPVLAKGFQARLIYGDGSSSRFFVDQSRIFTGHLTESPGVSVQAHIEDLLWNIQIFDKNDTFAIEPAWRLLNASENPKNDTMVAFRGSDLILNPSDGSSFCGAKHEEKEEIKYYDTHQSNSSTENGDGLSGRAKRGLSGNTCLLYMVADYDLYRDRCRNNHVTCSAIMISFVQAADEIYRASKFVGRKETIYTDVGLQIAELVIYAEYTRPLSGTIIRHFNEKDVRWHVHEKLDSFAFYCSMHQKRFCLNHLLTSYGMPMRILGLAWIGATCRGIDKTGTSQTNSGVSSFKDIVGGPVSSVQVNLVLAHEIGHNFGSDHDPQTHECAKPETQGGKYLMWHRSVTGKLPNHRKFSPCSLKAIGRLIERKTCYVEKSKLTTFCGNALVEEGEECDGGAFGLIGTDKCCTETCELKENAACSDANQACCKNCQIASFGQLCRPGEKTLCRKESYCTGMSYECPDSEVMADWADCLFGGQCFKGMCEGFCEIKSIRENRNLKPCFCEMNDTAACRWCCYDSSDPNNPGVCEQHSDQIVKNGMACYKGFCMNGRCEVYIASNVRRIYSYLTTLHTSDLVKFLKTNIVMAVILLSLVLWIPPSFCIYLQDNHQRRRREFIQSRFMLRASMMADGDLDTENTYDSDDDYEELFIHKTPMATVKEENTRDPSDKSKPESRDRSPMPSTIPIGHTYALPSDSTVTPKGIMKNAKRNTHYLKPERQGSGLATSGSGTARTTYV